MPDGVVQPFVDVAVWFADTLVTMAQYAVAGVFIRM